MPLAQQIHVDKLLSNVSVRYSNPELIAQKLFGEVPVMQSNGLYRTYSASFRLPETKRANKGEAREHTFGVSTASYSLERHALKDYVSDEDQDNFEIGDLRADTVLELKDTIMRRLEKSLCDLMTTTNWSLNLSLASGGEWSSNTTTTNPLPSTDTGLATVIANSGFKPNIAVIGQAGYVALKNHVSVLDRVKYTSREMSPAILAALVDVEELLVARASYNSAAEGATTAMSSIWDNEKMFFGYKPPRPGLKVPASGYIFRKNSPEVRRWMVEERQAEAIEVEMRYQAKVVASLTGFLVCNIV